MSKIDEATEILTALGLPHAQQNERSALTLLALAGLRPRSPWKNVKPTLVRIWDIMAFMRDVYGKDYAANTRETIRRQTIHQFEQARIVNRNPDEPDRPTNSGKTVYILTDEVVKVLKSYRTPTFADEVAEFLEKFGSLQAAYLRERVSHQVPLKLPDGSTVRLSPGKHNVLQAAVVEEFGPRFAPGATLLYLGDTAKKHIICQSEELNRLLIPITEHDKLPDIVLYDRERNWLFMIEAATSHGPMSPTRHRQLANMLTRSTAHPVYVTAFLTRSDYRKFEGDIAWETEVWFAETPDHMLHYNGPKFLGPYDRDEG